MAETKSSKGLLILSSVVALTILSASSTLTAKTSPACSIVANSKKASCPDSSFSISDQFLLAVAKNNKSLAQRLLQRGASINYRSQNRVVISRVNVRADKLNQFLAGSKRYQYASGSAYDIALVQGNAAIVLWLLQRGADPAAGYFKNQIENTHFKGSYPSSYLLLPYRQRAKIISVGKVLAIAVKANELQKARQLLKIEPRAIHYLGNNLLPTTLRLGKWEMVKLLLNQGADTHQLVNFAPMLYSPLESVPTNYPILEALLRHAKKRNKMDYQTFLSIAVRKKDARALRMLVNYGANLNPKNQKAPLFIAAEKKDIKTVSFLLKLGANPNIVNGGTTLLHRAIGNEQVALAKLLLQGGANINALDVMDRRPIDIAIHKRSPNLTKLLIAHRAIVKGTNSDKDTLLHIAVREDKLGVLQLLLASGARSLVNAKNNAKETPFQIAIRDSKLAMARTLLAVGAHVNVKDSQDRTPLQLAVNKKNLAFAKLLIKARADVNVKIKNYNDDSLLTNAVKQVNIPIIKLLLAARAKVNYANSSKQTALHIAVEKVDITMIRLLLNANADVNLRNSSKHTPLHIAINKKHLAMVNLLMQRKPQLNWADGVGHTPLHLAVLARNFPISNVLLKAGAQPNTVDINGDTPLFDALYWRKVKIASTLIDHGARINIANNHGKTPLDIALSKGLLGIAAKMRRAGAKTGEELGSAGAVRIKILKNLKR